MSNQPNDNGRQDTVYISSIATTPEKLWTALTDGAQTARYFFGRRIESDWKVGSTVKYWQADGTLDVSGTILECDPPKRVSFTWKVEWIDEFRDLPPAIVTFALDELGQVVRLTMTEAHPVAIDEKLLEGGRRGWPAILSGLKTLLETGKPLPSFDPKK
jgi:uncharacterized protein YndB with AHSA1/START domain